MIKRILYILIVFILSNTSVRGYNDGIRFIENKGQWEKQVLYKADLGNGFLYLENNGFTYDLFDTKHYNSAIHAHYTPSSNPQLSALDWHCYKLTFINSNVNSSINRKYKTNEYYNYFLGKNREKWASKAYGYYQIEYQELYKGINLNVYSDVYLKYDFIVAPHANPNLIEVNYKGVDDIKIKKDQLLIKTSVTNVIEKKPYAYQIINGEKIEVACQFVLKNQVVSYKFPNGYNNNYTLIIDPIVVFSAYSGSIANNFGYSATFDSKGFLYAGSSAFSSGYPTTLGAYNEVFNGGTNDIAITKFDTSGTYMIYSTYLGGSNVELPHSLIVNSFDELFILGTTSSADFPTTINSFDSTFGGGTPNNLSNGLGVNYSNGSDIIVSHLSTNGDSLMGSTYIGGSENDGLNSTSTTSSLNILRYNYADEIRGEIDIDKNDNIYIVSSTRSSLDFPIFGNVFQPNYGGGEIDGCIIKMDNKLQNIIWSSYLGGENHDAAYSLSIDSSDDIYVTGGTESNLYPISSSAVSSTYNGGRSDGFVSHISKDGSQIINSTFIGSDTYDQSYFVELDKSNNVYLLGQTEATDNSFIHNATYNTPGSGQFVCKITPELDSLIYSTVFGSGNGISISPTAFLVDLCSKIYLSGWGGSTNNLSTLNNNAGYTTGLPTTNDAYQSTTDGSDFYVMVLEDDVSNIVYGSFFGGSTSSEHVDGGTSRFDRKGKVYQAICAGCGGHSDLPIEPLNNPLDTNRNSCNLGVFKMDFGLPSVVADFEIPPIGCAPFTYTFNNLSLIQNNTNFYWNFGDNTTSTQFNPTHTYTQSGTYIISLIVSDTAACNLADTIQKTITILGNTSYDIIDINTCPNEVNQIGISPNPNPSITYSWFPTTNLSDPSISNPFASPSNTTTYSLIITNGICVDTLNQTIFTDTPDLYLVNNTTLCVNENVTLTAYTSGTASTFIWSSNVLFSDTLNNNITDSSLFVSTNQFSTYYVAVYNSNGCKSIDSVTITYHTPSTANFNLDNIQGCAPLTVNFNNTSGTNDFYLWNFGNGDTTSQNLNPIIIYNTPGTYNVSLTITDSICGSTDTKSATITVSPPVSLTIPNNPITTCDTALLYANSNGATTFIWSSSPSFTDTLNTNLQSDSLTVVVSDTTTYYLFATNGTCSNTASVVVNFIGAKINVPNGAVCSGESETLSVINLTNQTLTYNWQPSSEIISGETTANPTVNPITTTTYYVTAQNTFGCSASDSAIVTVSGTSINDISITADKDSLYNGEGTYLHANPDENFTYSWTPSNTLNNNTIANPFATPTTETTYTVLFTELVTGCEFYKTYTIYAWEINCAEPDVFLPNAFTPNGDLENDVLYVRGRFVEEMELKIYDRWGELLFETTKQNVGWDGSYKGNKVDPAVYVYHLKVKCIDGQEYFKKGNVTVIR
jgi:gliding motility-associated-like protein